MVIGITGHGKTLVGFMDGQCSNHYNIWIFMTKARTYVPAWSGQVWFIPTLQLTMLSKNDKVFTLLLYPLFATRITTTTKDWLFISLRSFKGVLILLLVVTFLKNKPKFDDNFVNEFHFGNIIGVDTQGRQVHEKKIGEKIREIDEKQYVCPGAL